MTVSFFIGEESVVGSSCRKALAAIYSLAFGGVERNLALFATFSANCIEHFSCTLDAVLSCGTAFLASLGFVIEALLCIEFLLTCGEHKLIAAIFAFQCLVLVHVFYLALKIDNFCPQTDSNRRL